MEKTDRKKSRIIKDIAIVLLLALILLTFMSNSLMSHFLPEVEVSTVGSGTLSTAIRGTGVVTSAGSSEITSPAVRTVKTVEIKEGQQLKKGDLLFTFEHVQDGEIDAELEILDQIFAEYNNYALQTPQLTDYNGSLWDVNINGIVEHVPIEKLEYYMGVSQRYAEISKYGESADAEKYQKNYNAYKETYDFAQKKKAETRNYETYAITAIDNTLEFTAKRIAAQQERIKEMRGETGVGNLFVPFDCTVTKVCCQPGDTVERNQALCVVETENSGHTLSFVVAPELAECLVVGDTATIGNGYVDNGLSASLSSIKMADNGKILTFSVKGKVSSGEELTLFVGKQSADYDLVIPDTALHTDSSGSYVLVAESLSGRLGSQYVARRAGVDILASDDHNCAISGNVSPGDWVVINTDSPIADGDQIRIVD